MEELAAILDTLIDRWCQRRALAPLRILLPVWPMPMGLTDDWYELRDALRHTRAMASQHLLADELKLLNDAIAHVDVAMSRRSISEDGLSEFLEIEKHQMRAELRQKKNP